MRWAMQLLSVTVQRGNAEMYRRSGLVISREQGLRYCTPPIDCNALCMMPVCQLRGMQ